MHTLPPSQLLQRSSSFFHTLVLSELGGITHEGKQAPHIPAITIKVVIPVEKSMNHCKSQSGSNQATLLTTVY